MTKRDKFDQVVESFGKMVSNLQQTTLDEVLHSVRYNFDYYCIHARLNYYSNSRNPRVIQARFKNQKLTTLRTNPHDPYYARPGEFLTLFKKEIPDTYYDDVSSYYARLKPRHVLTAPLQNQSRSSRGRHGSQGSDILRSSRARDITHTGNGSGSNSRDRRRRSSETSYSSHSRRRRSLAGPDCYDAGYDKGYVSYESPRCTLDDKSSVSKGGSCPVHLTPHISYKDFKISRNGQVLLEDCSPLRPSMSKRMHHRPQSSSKSNKKHSTPVYSMRRVSDTSRRIGSSSERRKHDHENQIRSVLEHGSKPASHERKEQHRHTVEIVAMLEEIRRISSGKSGSEMKLPPSGPELKKTRKIKRRLVKRVNESQGAQLRSDHSFVTADVSSNLIDMTSIKDNKLEESKESRIQRSRPNSSRSLEPPSLPYRPLSQPLSRKVLSSNVGADGRNSHISARKNLIDNRESVVYSDSGVKKSLRFEELERVPYSRPNTGHHFRTASLRNLSKDPRCHWKGVSPKFRQITTSDIALTAARLSTGSDRMTSSRQERPRLHANKKSDDAFAESFREARAQVTPLVTLSILDSYYDE